MAERSSASLVQSVVFFLTAVSVLRVAGRLLQSSGGEALERCESPSGDLSVGVILPTLNEATRVQASAAALAKLDGIALITVVDTGSTDDTVSIARKALANAPNARVIEAGRPPDCWNGKVWGLESAESTMFADIDWVLTIDADVTVDPDLPASLLMRAVRDNLGLISVATSQIVAGAALSMIHPAQLTTLVYRFGIPGRPTTAVHSVQANGQCFLIRRDVLRRLGGFASVRESICEDVTLARATAAAGYSVGFVEAGDLVNVQMYGDAADSWNNWNRSLPTRDRYFGTRGWIGLVEMVLAQGLVLPMLGTFIVARSRLPEWQRAVAIVSFVCRVGTLFGTRRAYQTCHWTYWLSPLADLPVTLQILLNAFRRTFVWRGRIIERGH